MRISITERPRLIRFSDKFSASNSLPQKFHRYFCITLRRVCVDAVETLLRIVSSRDTCTHVCSTVSSTTARFILVGVGQSRSKRMGKLEAGS